jgi:hypothetical protein
MPAQLHGGQESTGYNSTYPKGGVSCSKDSFVDNQTLVFLIKFCGKSPALRVAAKRWEKSPFGTIFPNDRPATPTVGKPSLHSHDAFPTAAFDAFRIGAKKLLPETTTKPGGRYMPYRKQPTLN